MYCDVHLKKKKQKKNKEIYFQLSYVDAPDMNCGIKRSCNCTLRVCQVSIIKTRYVLVELQRKSVVHTTLTCSKC